MNASAIVKARYRVPGVAAGAGGSRPFLVVGEDERRYWLKAPNNPQGPMVPVTEQIVARMAMVIGIPVCEPRLIEISQDMAGIQIDTNYILQPCVAHGSVAVEGAFEVRGALAHRAEDDNARRHAGIVALYDWMWGADDQWLRSAPEQNRFYSHDHGCYLPGGPNWTRDQLLAARDRPHPLSGPMDGLDRDELNQLADRLEAVTREEITASVENLPDDWPIDEPTLAAVVDFSLHRAQPVAGRLRALAV